MGHGVAQGVVAKIVHFCILFSLHDPSLIARQICADARGERLAGGFRGARPRGERLAGGFRGARPRGERLAGGFRGLFCPIFDKMMSPKGSGSICRGASYTKLACFASWNSFCAGFLGLRV